ncbi:type II toxin-antitoxin system HicB family antitoxin [Euzebya sp.]|uniref:type II toxin-antitoxin system HicB family antitoxin n=1 Tax=Euzebya sp. TaxID=1971409 RepID=UPI003510ECA7
MLHVRPPCDVARRRTLYDVRTLTAAISQEGDLFVAQCLEVDVASQGATHDEARANLIEALELFFEDGDLVIGPAPIIEQIDVAV